SRNRQEFCPVLPLTCLHPLDIRSTAALMRQALFGAPRLAAAIEPGDQDYGFQAADRTARRLSAEDLPVFRSATTSNATFCPSLSPCIPARSTALMCTKTSLPPSSGWMKPKPFWTLNHFTVPCVISSSFSYVCSQAARQRSRFVRDLEESRQSDA